MRFTIFIILSILIYGTVISQVPVTNVYLFDIDNNGSKFNLEKPMLLTNFNNKGYNNQPSFFNEDKLYISSDYKANLNTEIFELDLRKNELLRVTQTTQSEYSPTLMPNERYFSVIRQSNIGDKDQLLWKYPVNRSNEGEAIIQDLTNVGYHSWIDDDKVIMFLVGEPHKFVEYTLSTGLQEIVADDIGRAIHKRGNIIYFVQKVSRKFWYLKAYNFIENTMEIITQTLREKEDFVIMDDGTFLMSSGAFLFAYQPEQDKVWRKVFDFKVLGLNKVTRLAVHNNKLAVVNVSE